MRDALIRAGLVPVVENDESAFLTRLSAEGAESAYEQLLIDANEDSLPTLSGLQSKLKT